MTIAILEAGVRESDLTVQFEVDRIVVQLRRQGLSEPITVVAGTLYAEIVPDLSKVTWHAEKVLIKLRKKTEGEWYELWSKEKKTAATAVTKPAATAVTKPAATAAKPAGATTETAEDAPVPTPAPAEQPSRPQGSQKKDWDSIEKEIAAEEEQEKPQGDDAMNKLFQQLYANADPDTRRAMIKSYQTSGGTVLSTNWNEVEKTDYEKERTAPDGVEWKNWEGDKLPMKKDD